MWVNLKVKLVYANPKENSCLNAYVLLRSENFVATTIPFIEFSFAQGRAKVKFGGVC
jgi:hypothetical protein